MSTDPQAEFDDVVDELTATSPAILGKMFGMPTLKQNGKAFAGYYSKGPESPYFQARAEWPKPLPISWLPDRIEM